MRKAFTLIEVLLVVTIMAILTVAGLRGLVNIQRSARVNDMRDRFVSFLDVTRSFSLNGKQVNCTLEPNIGKPCVPKSFGVSLISDTACTGSSKKIVEFFFENDTQNTITSSNTLDSYCLNPQVTLLTTPLGTSEQFSYLTPYGVFTYPGYNPTKVDPIILDFCDGSSCASTSLKKSITLYSNVGVPE